MPLLGSSQRFWVCFSLTDCEVAILGAQAPGEMMTTDQALATNLITLMARKLLRRMWMESARLC